MIHIAKYQSDSEAKIKRAIKVFISLNYYLFLKLCRICCRALGMSVPGTFIILIYHSVKERYRDRFAKQMDEVCKIGKVVNADYSGTLENNYLYIAVTFDDGYQNIINNALPEMIKRNIPATIFMTTGYFGKKADWVVDKKSHNYGETILNEEQIIRLHECGVSFGSHTVSHPYLANLNRDALASEIRESKMTLEKLLSSKITLCSLPYGAVDKSESAVFKDAGYKRVFLNVPMWRDNNSKEIYYGRTDIKPNDWLIEYRLKFRGAYAWQASVSRIKDAMSDVFGKKK